MASRMRPFLHALWANRKDLYPSPDSDVCQLLGDKTWFIVDVFPIRLNRPKDSIIRKGCWHGKYAGPVLNVSAAVSMSGVPVYFTVHNGSPGDVYIWNNNQPVDLEPDESGLADKAYIGGDHLLVPFKDLGSRPLTEYERAWNKVLSFYRSTVEHAFALIKSFFILSSKYRGHIFQDHGFIEDVLTIIMTVVAMHVLESPLKDISVHSLLPNCIAAAIPAAVAAERAAILNGERRQHINGRPIGTIHDIVVEDGVARGLGPEPNDAAIDSGHTIEDFAKGDRVLVWWWGLYWTARVHYVATRSRTLSIRWDYDHSVTNAYAPRLVFGLDL